MSGGLLRAFAATLVVALVSLPFAHEGYTSNNGGRCAHPTGLIFSSLGVITGIWADTFDQHAFIANIVITPLALVGGVFYSARTLHEPWSTLTRIDPLYYLVDATQSGLTGFHEASTAIALSVAGAVAITAHAAAVALVARGWRLKP
jgi:ABC-2 type transport system permease protein